MQNITMSVYRQKGRPILQKNALQAVEAIPKFKNPEPTLYITIFSFWIASLLWFDPRLIKLLTIADNGFEYASLVLFIIFIDFAWLYGIYNVCIVIFSILHRHRHKNITPVVSVATTDVTTFPPVAILYTTYNDFVEESVVSCLQQDYPCFKLYMLDDSTDPVFMNKVDEFAKRDTRIVVVRRPVRKGFKAGNLNYALEHIANKQKYFAIADADEILPADFLRRLVPQMEKDKSCGFIQANHMANPQSANRLQKDMGVGIDIHWKWYQPLRNRYGFVMFLGHGALLRYDCWKMIGGFPDIVSEDLGFAIAIREKGYRGRFEESVICYEDFPDTVRSFRIRHMKWTRGTCEFLQKKAIWLLKAKNISWVEKADILFPTLNLPLTLIFFLFMINANILMPYFFGHAQNLTMVLGGHEYVLPIRLMDHRFSIIDSLDFFLITLLTFFAPVLCFILAMRKKPLQMIRFLCHSTVLYAALSILSAIGVIAYIFSGKAVFLVTGDKKQHAISGETNYFTGIKEKFRKFIHQTHPDNLMVQALEICFATLFIIAGLKMMQISFFGLCLSFILLPFLHHIGWKKSVTKLFVYLPFILIVLGIVLGSLSALGMQSVFFGYGFHF